MKGYQISQYDVPICRKGWLEVPGANGDSLARIGINRVHMEEDVARLIHIAGPDGGPGHTLMDVNRAGTPLMEVVSEPDIRSPKQAEQYIETLQAIIRYLGVGTANMEEGSFRCDANVSVRPRGSTTLGTRVEVKNMNRVRAVTRAIEHEVVRQASVLEDGGRIVQETRGWDDVRGVTVPQRSKEEAHDYRYFPEPDIPPLVIGRDWVVRVRARLPELPAARRARFQERYGLSEYDASLLTASRAVADYFEAVASVVSGTADQDRRAFAKEAANWLNGEMARLLNEDGQDISAVKIIPAQLASLVERFQKRELNNATAKAVFEEMYRTGEDPEAIIKAKGLTKVAGLSALGPIVEQVVSANKSAVADFLAGKEPALRFLVGQVMKASRGQADAEVAAKLLRERLGALKAGR
jgi:aspartyl-tRNA(Asn)/glutamyl-tRNA(Gln) amidotransferase subunit B